MAVQVSGHLGIDFLEEGQKLLGAVSRVQRTDDRAGGQVQGRIQAGGAVTDVVVGDTLNVYVRIIEGDKERIQIYQGVLIAERGRGINRTITVRRIVANEGVERIWPLHSPRIAKIEVVRRGDARRAKLYFLRKRVGRSRRLRDQRRGLRRLGSEISPRKGYICLESEGSPVEFRNIRIKELPSTGATPEQTATLAEAEE